MTTERAYDSETVDLGWQPEPLWEEWPRGRDTEFVMWRMEEAFEDIAVKGRGGKLLDLACGDAEHIEAFHRAGWHVYGLEPSPEMIVRANERAASVGAVMPIVRGIGEVLPYKDETFDRIVCMSSLDHFANPASQSWSDISVPAAVNQPMSLTSVPRIGCPWNHRRRQNTACSDRRRIKSFVNPSNS